MAVLCESQNIQKSLADLVTMKIALCIKVLFIKHDSVKLNFKCLYVAQSSLI